MSKTDQPIETVPKPLEQEFDSDWLQLLESAYTRTEAPLGEFFFIFCISAMLGAVGFFVVSNNPKQDFFVQFFSTLTNVYASLLGFAIAGYALFAVLGESKYLTAIMEHRTEPDNGAMPLLKLHLLCLVKFLLILGIGLILFGSALLLAFIHSYTDFRLFTFSQLILNELGMLSGVLIGSCIGTTIVEAKSFIFNIYNIALTRAFFHYGEAEDENSDKDCFVESEFPQDKDVL